MSGQTSVTKFIEKERAEGKTDTQIKHDLLDAGWHMDIVKHAMGELKKDHPLPKDHAQNKKLTPTQLAIGACVVIIAAMLVALYV